MNFQESQKDLLEHTYEHTIGCSFIDKQILKCIHSIHMVLLNIN